MEEAANGDFLPAVLAANRPVDRKRWSDKDGFGCVPARRNGPRGPVSQLGKHRALPTEEIGLSNKGVFYGCYMNISKYFMPNL